MPALAPSLRDAVRAHDKAAKAEQPDSVKTLAKLQDLVLHDAGVEPPEPVKLQRITWKGVAMVALTVFGVYILLSQILSLDGALEQLTLGRLVVGRAPRSSSRWARPSPTPSPPSGR